jgi:hypothetical protein
MLCKTVLLCSVGNRNRSKTSHRSYVSFVCFLLDFMWKCLCLFSFQNSISCTALKTSQGMFSGISRRMSSFIFGTAQAQTSGAVRHYINLYFESGDLIMRKRLT